MIHTITMNPSLDYIVTTDFKTGYTNRTTAEEMFPGGKGINVSLVLKNLGFDSVALGFVAGFVGEEIVRRTAGIYSGFIRLEEGNSRINVKLKNSDGTEINGMGPHIPQEKVDEFMNQMKSLNKKDVLVLGGSVPSNLSNEIYMDILKAVKCEYVVVDATGDLLVNCLQYKPFLIKPNLHELEEIFKVKIESNKDIEHYARELQKKGARNVLISMGKNGAMLVDETGIMRKLTAPKGKLINAVGSGDSMVAGFLAGYLEKNDYEYAFKQGVATGSGSAFSEHFASKELVESLMATM